MLYISWPLGGTETPPNSLSSQRSDLQRLHSFDLFHHLGAALSAARYLLFFIQHVCLCADACPYVCCHGYCHILWFWVKPLHFSYVMYPSPMYLLFVCVCVGERIASPPVCGGLCQLLSDVGFTGSPSACHLHHLPKLLSTFRAKSIKSSSFVPVLGLTLTFQE